MLRPLFASETHPEISIHEPMEFGGRLEHKFSRWYEVRRQPVWIGSIREQPVEEGSNAQGDYACVPHFIVIAVEHLI